MKTVVIQSYRTTGVSGWRNKCLRSVREWAAHNGFEYTFLGDEIFERVPGWYRDKVGGNVLLMTDLARLVLAKEQLDDGFERAVWVDADVIVFDPYGLSVDVDGQYGFCRQIWIGRRRLGRGPEYFLRRYFKTQARSEVNNAVAVFHRHCSFLAFYIDKCQAIVRNKTGKFNGLEVGTTFLTQLSRIMPVPIIDGIGLFSPLVNRDDAESGGAALPLHINAFAQPL